MKITRRNYPNKRDLIANMRWVSKTNGEVFCDKCDYKANINQFTPDDIKAFSAKFDWRLDLFVMRIKHGWHE